MNIFGTKKIEMLSESDLAIIGKEPQAFDPDKTGEPIGEAQRGKKVEEMAKMIAKAYGLSDEDADECSAMIKSDVRDLMAKIGKKYD